MKKKIKKTSWFSAHPLLSATLILYFILGLGALKQNTLGTYLAWTTAFIIYFTPSFVAFHNKKKNAGAIFLLNATLGWTLLGWIISLIWAVMKDNDVAQVKSAEK